MENLKGLTSFVAELRARKRVSWMSFGMLTRLVRSWELGGSNRAEPGSTGSPRTKRFVRAASRRKIALAQKARWVSIRKKSQPAIGKTAGTASAKRKTSSAGRKRIAAATRARWAEFQAAKKKAA
jgi:hypothetical protein